MIIMKKLISLILVLLCLCSLAACAKDQPKVWGWAQNLNRENISSAEIWSADDENIPLDEAQILELVTLLNHLSKGNFTENKKLVGITPLVGIKMQIDAENFAGYYYVEASTLFRREDTGKDMPAELILPNVKIQSNFTFTMASSGDPSTFTFTMDAFPDYTRFDRSKKVLAAIQIIKEAGSQTLYRKETTHSEDHDVIFG